MVDFDLFVKTLGTHAKHYTPEQLKQLHVEVRKLAEVLLTVHEAKAVTQKKPSSPQPDLDESDGDRTMEQKITEQGDKSASSHAQHS